MLYVKAQMDGGRRFIHVLTARALRAYPGQGYLFIRNNHAAANRNHADGATPLNEFPDYS